MKLCTIVTGVLVLFICMVAIPPAFSGGWAVVTLEKLPEGLTAGEPFQVSFKVRQHGQHFVEDLSARVIATHVESDREVIANAVHGDKPGQYTAELTLPEAGTWGWSIKAWHQPRMPDLHVGPAGEPAPRSQEYFWALLAGAVALMLAAGIVGMRFRVSLPKAAALAGICIMITGLLLINLRPDANTLASAPDAALRSQAEIGHDLFIAKGCLSCHVNSNIEARYLSFSSQIGPDLSDYPTTAEYLREWLNNPASIKPKTQMPDLELSENEIEALIAFLLADR